MTATLAPTGAADPLDAALAAAGLELWIGAEPTFTRRESTAPWWLWQADPDEPGADDKRRRAATLALALGHDVDGAQVRRVVGRQYPDEDAPRFCYGVALPRAALAAALAERGPRPPAPDDDVAGLVAATPVAAPAADAAADARLAWLTVTADPGVVEVNTAPCADLATFAAHLEQVWAAAEAAGLSSFRWRYNGDEVDSGGGGQLTLGGPSAAASPFFRHPALLPRLVRYLGNHPALSYWFLGECAGSASQSPRPDEGVRERWEELGLACAWLEREAAAGRVTPARLWSTLAPLLVDAAGNSHRAELNVEKLWNPHLTGRGQLGVVELRAFRMPRHPADMVAAAALVRAVAARCALAPYDEPLADWGAELHDRWALPFFLADDLDAVLDDLAAHGLPLERHHGRLRHFRAQRLGQTRVGRLRLELSRAVEFWPLLGDVASQERATARLVDASSERLELVAETEAGTEAGTEADGRLTVAVGGHAVIPRVQADGPWRYHVLGLRRRQYAPAPGLVPELPADEPLALTVAAGAHAARITWHAWRPGGGAYDGLPATADEARARREERLTIEAVAPAAGPAAAPRRLTTWSLDLRVVGLVAGAAADAAGPSPEPGPRGDAAP